MKEQIQQIGFLPLLDSGIEGFSAEDIVAEGSSMQFSKNKQLVNHRLAVKY